MKAFKRDNAEYIIMALNSADDDFVWKHSGITPLKALLGSYQGRIELSYLVPRSDDAMRLANAFNQECVIVLSAMENGRRTATSVQPVPKSSHYEKELGTFVNVGYIQPNADGWTQDLSTGDYYVIK